MGLLSMPPMPGGLPTWNAQQPQGPRPMGAGMGGPQQQANTPYMPQLNLNIPQYGNGYEGDAPLGSIPQSISSAFNFSNLGNPTNLGPRSFAQPPPYGANYAFNSLGPRMNAEMPVTWFAEDWKRNLPD